MPVVGYWLGKIYLCGAIIGITYLIIRMTLNYHSFCWPEKRWLSDKEFIDRAIRISMQLKYVPKGTVVPYRSKDAFIEKNPDCCDVNTTTNSKGKTVELKNPHNRVQATWGRRGATVLMKNDYEYIDNETKEVKSAKASYKMYFSNCGEYISH